MTVVLHSDGVTLRPLTHADADALLQILGEREVAQWWEGYDRARVLDELVAEGDGESFGIVVADDDGNDRLVGMIQYYEQDDPDYRHAGIDLFVDPSVQRRGVGRAAVVTLVRHLADDLGHHRLIVDPSERNERSVAFFSSIGFRQVGVLRRYERRADGTWGDNVLLELLIDDLEA
jgi:aminoglycoside 6'-N-acetyltransferase